ncbi:MAG: 4-alpha-glucanotransferase [Planctomycetes bacterium]|nr:4-alpha-glucanotransferase [Planctomycetota bacterium]
MTLQLGVASKTNISPGVANPGVDELAALAGIQSEYIDVEGRVHRPSARTKLRILQAMGIARGGAGVYAAECERLINDPWRRLVEPTTVVRRGRDAFVYFYIPDEGADPAARLFVRLRGEDGSQAALELSRAETAESRSVDGRNIIRIRVPAPDLEYGAWEVEASWCGDDPRAGAGILYVAPPYCYLPKPVDAGGRIRGYSVQFYSLRSKSDLGCGGFRAAAELGEALAKRHGAALLGLSPLHATPNRAPGDYSPYCPLSRVYKNSIYLDVLSLPEVVRSMRAARLLAEPSTRREIESLRSAPSVNYQKTAELQDRILRAAFEDFINIKDTADPRARDFRSYKETAGESLQQFATFMALRAHFLALSPPIGYFRDWPAELQDSRSEAVAAFRKSNAREVEVQCFTQWQVDRELTSAQQRLKSAGMAVGFYHDLAVGSSAGSADAWMDPEVFLYDAEVGAPPDIFNKEGQVWGVLPMSPIELKIQHYGPFIQMLRSAMRGGGALRIDHAMGLWRLWWVPRGAPATEGAYVQYPVDDLLGILALESWRASCMIVGEDLGTVAPGVRERMAEERIVGCRLTLFERAPGGSFISPEHYPFLSAASFSTHDLPTFAGYWQARDVVLRMKLNLYRNAAEAREAPAARESDKRQLAELLNQSADAKSLDIHAPAAAALAAYHQLLARSGSAIALASIEDSLGEEHQRNLPGTTHQYQNWVARLPMTVPELLQSPAFLAAAEAFGVVTSGLDRSVPNENKRFHG